MLATHNGLIDWTALRQFTRYHNDPRIHTASAATSRFVLEDRQARSGATGAASTRSTAERAVLRYPSLSSRHSTGYWRTLRISEGNARGAASLEPKPACSRDTVFEGAWIPTRGVPLSTRPARSYATTNPTLNQIRPCTPPVHQYRQQCCHPASLNRTSAFLAGGSRADLVAQRGE